MSDVWLQTDVGPHFLDSLEFFERQIDWVANDKRAWPWVIISAVTVVQSACVLYFDERETVSVSSLIDKSSEQVWRQLNSEPIDRIMSRKLLNPVELLKKVRREKPSLFEGRSVNCYVELVSFRNLFVHFTPKGHSLLLDGVPATVWRSLLLVLAMLSDKGLYGDNRISKMDREIAMEVIRKNISTLKSLQSAYL